LLIVVSCVFFSQQISKVIVKISKEERSELNWKLESTEDKEDSPEVNVSVMPNLQTKLHSAAPDEYPPLKQFEDEPAEDLDDATM